MDEVDFRLLGELRKRPLATYEELARAVQRSLSTVRQRLSDLGRDGTLQGFAAMPAAEALGLEGTAAAWDTRVPMDELLAVAGTVAAGDTVDGQTRAMGYAADAEAWVAAANRVAGREPTQRLPIKQYRGPPLGPLELRVLRAMVEEPRGTAEALARLCGLSAKTVRSRRATLLEDGAVSIAPIIRGDRSAAIVCHLHVHCGPRQVGAVMGALSETVGYTYDEPVLCLYFRASSLHEQAERLAAVRALEVDEVEVVQDQNLAFNGPAVLALIDDALARWR